LARAEDTALAEKRKSDEYQATISQLTFDNERLQRALDQARSRQESFEDGEAKRVLDLWSIHFPKMTFERQPARWVVHRNHRDRMSLEKMLVELHSSQDPAALSRGKMQATGEHHLRFRLDGVECRLFYKVNSGQITITKLATNQQCH
jgi:hypothetical protein